MADPAPVPTPDPRYWRVTVPIRKPWTIDYRALAARGWGLIKLTCVAVVLFQVATREVSCNIHWPPPLPWVNPKPPGPIPTPVPPKPPTPPQPPAPIPKDGFRVLMLFDSGSQAKLPATQLAVLYAKSIRDYLNSKCPLGEDGKTREWRIWDASVDSSAESHVWQDAMKRPHASLPWLIVSTGKIGFEGPLPGTIDDTLSLLKKYGEIP